MKLVPQDLDAVVRIIQQLQRDLEALRTERRAAATTIGDGGSLVIDGGDVVMLDTDGSFLFRLGEQAFGDRGISINRADGTLAFEVAKPNPLAVQAWRLKDNAGTTIVSESGFGIGLGRPRIPSSPFPVATPSYGTYGPEVSTTAGTFTTLFAVHDRRQNPLWSPVFRVRCTDGTTAAEVRVVHAATGTQLVEFGAGTWTGVRAAGSTDYVELAPPLNIPAALAVDDRYRFEVQVRRTAGTGTVFLAIPESLGG